VRLDSKDATVRLDTKDATVRLDTKDATVRLDANAKVTVSGNPYGDVPRPTPDQLRPNTPPSTNARVVTNYSVFKRVAYSKGAVVTGWSFSSNEDAAPSYEYCYYTETVNDGVGVRVDLAQNGQFNEKGRSPAAFDRKSAAANCVWFGGGFTRS
jgi:hypothetical protein